MKILDRLTVYLYVGGLSFNPPRSRFYMLLFYFWIGSLIAFVWGLTVFFTSNLHNLSKVFKEMVFELGFIVYSIKGLIYNRNRSSYLKLYNRLQQNADERINESTYKFYETADRRSMLFIKIFYITIGITILSITAEPLVSAAAKYFTVGELIPSDWYNPVPLVFYGSNPNVTPGYEIAYFVNSLAFMAMLLYVSGLDSVFLGFGVHITAGFQDLQQMIISLDEIDPLNMENETEFLNRVKECINFHNVILGCLNIYQQVSSEMIFLSMVETLSLMCSILFQLSKWSKLRPSDIFFNINAYISMQFVLFIYSFIGTLLTTEGTKVSLAAYSAEWYRRHPKYRKYYLLMLQFAQRERHLKGLNFFECSMETFAWVLKAAFSTLALLRTIEGS